MRPRMVIIAGPPDSEKSVAFPVSSFGIDYFNADGRADQINNAFYQGIPLEIRAAVNDEFERFVQEHIRQRKSFAMETTLRSDITFQASPQARAEGFEIYMRYIALSNFSQNLKRVTARARAGGHSAPADQLRRIHAAGLNLPRAIRETDELPAYDSSAPGRQTELVLSARKASINFLSARSPQWLEDELRATNMRSPNGSERSLPQEPPPIRSGQDIGIRRPIATWLVPMLYRWGKSCPRRLSRPFLLSVSYSFKKH